MSPNNLPAMSPKNNNNNYTSVSMHLSQHQIIDTLRQTITGFSGHLLHVHKVCICGGTARPSCACAAQMFLLSSGRHVHSNALAQLQRLPCYSWRLSCCAQTGAVAVHIWYGNVCVCVRIFIYLHWLLSLRLQAFVARWARAVRVGC